VRAFVAVLAMMAVGMSLPASGETKPAVLAKFLERNSGYRLLTLDDTGDFKEAFESKAFQFSPLVIADANGDKKPDLVAVLVKRGAVKLYSVVSFHGTNRGFRSEPIWIVQDSTQVILGVDVSPLAITPITCYECDANAVYGWTGRDYDFFQKGDSICLRPGAEIFAKPDWKSTIVFRAPPVQNKEMSTAQAEILDYGPSFQGRIGPYKRWYVVRVTLPTGSRTGFIATEFFKIVGP